MTAPPADDTTLEELAAKQAITELASRYAIALDNRDWDGLRDVFTADVVMSFAHIGERHGPDAIIRVCMDALLSLTSSQHLIGTVLTRYDGRKASSTSYFQAQHVLADRHFLVGGTYVDELIRTDGGWRITRRVQTVGWTTGDSHVLAGTV